MSKKKKIVLFVSITMGLILLIGITLVLRMYFKAKNNPMAAFSSQSSSTIQTVMIPAASDGEDENEEVENENIDESGVIDVRDDDKLAEVEEEIDENYSDRVNSVIDPKFMENKVNVLLLGWDQSPERNIKGDALYRDDDNNFRSDVLILLVIDFETKKVDMISVPRDSYVKIYDTKGKWKVNAAFAKGGATEKEGFSYAMNTVSDLMGGVPIDHYVGVNMEGLKALVDAMGGIDYDVDVEIKLNGRVLEEGPQHLNGQNVLDYCRARKGIGTDINRIDRQQRVLFTIFEQMKSSGQITKIPKIYTALSDMIWTNLNIEQIASLSLYALDLNMNNLNRHTLEGQYMSAYGAQFYVLNQSSKGKLIENIFNFKPKFDKEHDLSFVRGEMASRATASRKESERVATIQATQRATQEAVKKTENADDTLVGETTGQVNENTENAAEGQIVDNDNQIVIEDENNSAQPDANSEAENTNTQPSETSQTPSAIDIPEE